MTSRAPSLLPWALALSAQAVLLQAVWVGVRLMIGYRAIAAGADASFIALLAAALAAPALFAALPIGRLSDRIGGSILTLLGTAMIIAGTAALLVVPGLVILIVSSAVVGLGNVAAMVGQQAFVAHRTRGVSSDSGFGTLSAGASIGQVVGPPMVTISVVATGPAGSTALNTTIGLLTSLACAILALPLGLLLLRVDRQDEATTPRSIAVTATRDVLKTPGMWKAVTVSGFILVTMDLVYAFVPVWATENGIDAAVVGWLLALRALVSVLSRFGLTRLVNRFGRKTLLLIAMSVGVASLILLPLANEYYAILVMIGLGICLGLPQPLTLAWVIGITQSKDHGAALGLRMTGNRLAQVSIPMAVSAFAAPLGVAGIFWANALLLVLSAILVTQSSPNGHGRYDPE